MAVTKRRYTKEEFAARGDTIYARDVEPKLTKGHVGQFVAIDIESGTYAIGDDEMHAGDQLRARTPGAQIWIVRVGSPFVHRFGGRALRQSR